MQIRRGVVNTSGYIAPPADTGETTTKTIKDRFQVPDRCRMMWKPVWMLTRDGLVDARTTWLLGRCCC